MPHESTSPQGIANTAHGADSTGRAVDLGFDNRFMPGCNPEFGNPAGRGAFSFEPGIGTTIAKRIRFGGVGQPMAAVEP